MLVFLELGKLERPFSDDMEAKFATFLLDILHLQFLIKFSKRCLVFFFIVLKKEITKLGCWNIFMLWWDLWEMQWYYILISKIQSVKTFEGAFSSYKVIGHTRWRSYEIPSIRFFVYPEIFCGTAFKNF